MFKSNERKLLTLNLFFKQITPTFEEQLLTKKVLDAYNAAITSKNKEIIKATKRILLNRYRELNEPSSVKLKLRRMILTVHNI